MLELTHGLPRRAQPAKEPIMFPYSQRIALSGVQGKAPCRTSAISLNYFI